MPKIQGECPKCGAELIIEIGWREWRCGSLACGDGTRFERSQRCVDLALIRQLKIDLASQQDFFANLCRKAQNDFIDEGSEMSARGCNACIEAIEKYVSDVTIS